jgi:hypothetical protein
LNRSPSLHAHDRTVDTPFGLLGTDENALTFALGYTFQRCLPLLQWFLKEVGIKGLHRSSLKDAHIRLQRHQSGQGVTDIEIYLPGQFHVIVEAKIGLSEPKIVQCRKYLPRFEKDAPIQKLVAVIESADHTFVKRYGQQDKQLSKRLMGFSWPSLLPECVRLMLDGSVSPESKAWVRYFYNFLDKEFDMKTYTTEVWILAINTEPMWPGGSSHWDVHQKHKLWWAYNDQTVRPLYIAFRVNAKLDSIYRVKRIEHSVPISDRVPEMRRLKWAKKPATIWHFGPPVPLAKPLRTGRGMRARRVRSDLDLLLTCNSVKEIEDEMRKRRQESKEKK